jgi:quinoprotein glucose dehydrogenase
VEVKRGGETIPALAVVNKSALLFLLDRRDGKPIYEVRETPVPQSSVPGEASWPTQPVPVKPPPLARESFTRADIASLTPQLQSFCTSWFDSKKMAESQRFSPLPFETPIVRFPGSGGGVNWAGGAFDRTRGLYIINTMDLGSVEYVVRDKDGGIVSGVGPDSFFADWGSRMPCHKPPWGSLTAVDVNTGDIAWRVNLGVTDALPEGQRDTGRPNLGGPIVTASGVVFIGATDDRRFRAFDAKTGKALWTVELGAAAHATPITYLGKDRRQYVAVTATGGTFLASPVTGDEIVAFSLDGKAALPRPQPVSAPAPPPAAGAAVNTAPVVLPDEPRKQILQRACSACHAVDVVAARRRTPEEWGQVIGRMQDYGAAGTPADFQAIHQYLSQHASSRAGQ